MSVEDVRMRAERTRAVHQARHHSMRTQVEVDPGIGMRGFEGVQSLIADYKWAIDIEICVFRRKGLISYPGTDELLVEGLKRGAKIGGAALRQGRGRPDPSHLRAGARVRRRHRHSSRRRPHARCHERPPGARTDRQVPARRTGRGRAWPSCRCCRPTRWRRSPAGWRTAGRGHGAADHRPVPDWAATRITASGAAWRRQPGRARGELLALPTTSSTRRRRRLLADPHRQPLCQRAAGRSPREAARMPTC